jgi:hypothetical protein
MLVAMTEIHHGRKWRPPIPERDYTAEEMLEWLRRSVLATKGHLSFHRAEGGYIWIVDLISDGTMEQEVKGTGLGVDAAITDAMRREEKDG